jgi:hypothetical protein
MPCGRHSVSPAPVSRRSSRPATKVWYRLFAAVAAFAVVVTVVTRVTVNRAASTALSQKTCATEPKLAADTSGSEAVSRAAASRAASAAGSTSSVPLGVNASYPSQLAGATAEFGHMPIIRVYYTGMPDPDAWTTGAPGVNRSAVVVSFRSPPATVLSGKDDAALAHFFDTAPTGHPIYYTYYHEPEPLITGKQFTLAQYRAAWTHIVAIADAAHNPYLRSTMILMAWDLDPRSGINFRDFLPAGHVISVLAWDAYPAGTVHDQDPQPTPPGDFMAPEEAASRSVGLPYGFAEFALGTAADRPQWLQEVASYLQGTGALFGTLFNSTGFPWMELTDSASIQAWRSAVAHSGPGMPVPAVRVAPKPAAAPSATAAPRPKPSATAEKTPAVLAITEPAVRPDAFVPTGANHVRIVFKLTQAANIAVCVVNSGGQVVREFDRQNQPAGWSSVWYFGYDQRGKLLPAGRYSVLVVAADAQSSVTARASLTIGTR